MQEDIVPPINRNNGTVDYASTSKKALLPAAEGARIGKDSRQNSSPPAQQQQQQQYGSTTPDAKSDFRVAIICALTIEADAVYALFDSRLDEDDVQLDKSPNDPNVYSTGTIGRHYVVLTHMANMSKANAATVATNCGRTFPNVRLALVVGICGVVPFSANRTDIMLGDVVISEGVFQYDLGRHLPQEFRPKNGMPDSLARPISNIRAALSKWKGDAWKKNLQSNMYKSLGILQATSELPVQYPGALHDKLFEANYPHADHGMFCDDACDDLRIQRRRSESPTIQPRIHFGIVASGDSVMKSGEERDRIARKHDIIAFEMESAGVWHVFPCIVVKGACDYADSHKNKEWQGYAAATAAACMKALLNDRALSL
ncbi:nucleoside phosphorylase domain-containing protein [Trichoderma austrokoningii]